VERNRKFLMWMPLDSQCICEIVNEEKLLGSGTSFDVQLQ
jgi:hypothetical protein